MIGRKRAAAMLLAMTVVSASAQAALMPGNNLPPGASQDGTDATGVTAPNGGGGIRGWLSGIYHELAGTLTATVSGTVAVSNLPSTQAVSGTVSVGNFPSTQQVSGAVTVSNLPAIPAGSNAIGSVTLGGGTASIGTIKGTPLTQVALDVSSVATGGTAVTALSSGHASAGGWLQNPAAATASLCVSLTGTATTSTPSTCLAPGQGFSIPPTAGAVSVISSDSAHGFAGQGLQ